MEHICYKITVKNSCYDKEPKTVQTYRTLDAAKERFENLVFKAWRYYCDSDGEGCGDMIERGEFETEFIFHGGSEIIKLEKVSYWY